MPTPEAIEEANLPAQDSVVALPCSARVAPRVIALSIGYVVLCLALDRVSYIGAIGITPWNPSAGLLMALLVIKGLRYAPLVLAAELLSNVTLPTMSVPAVAILLGSSVVTAGYAGAAAILRRAGLQSGIRSSADVVMLLIVTIIAAGLVASGFVGSYAAAGFVPWSEFAEAGFHYWIGDAIGIAVFIPPILLMYQQTKHWTTALPVQNLTLFQLVEFATQAASIVVALAAVFTARTSYHELGHFYFLFLPLIWVATRHGLLGAIGAVLLIQIGLIAGLQIQGSSELAVRSFQLFMFALTASGLNARCGRFRAPPLGAHLGGRRRPARGDP
jgi:hypothetical protein